MKTALSSHPLQSRRGIALISVVSIVAIMTILVVAMLSLSQNERRAATKYADGEMAKLMADSAVNIVIGQISEATKRESGTWGTWASQPGAVRKYRANGGFERGFKLYSDEEMVVEGTGDGSTQEEAFASAEPDPDWQKLPEVWTDLNEPVFRPDKDGDGLPEVIYPIVDPRAFIRSQHSFKTGLGVNEDSTNIEGFSYKNDFPGVVDAQNLTDTNARLPMPVRWMYMLKNGVVGTMRDTGGRFVFNSISGDAPTVENPIIGRIAFWTDDETSKININTASEPTYWATPYLHHDRDYSWMVYQPARFEFQRYPGHPATIALSSVLFPNRDLDSYGKSEADALKIRAIKERIYEIIPKINPGGSQVATVPFWASADPLYSNTQFNRVKIAEALDRHLYASVDELIFSSQVQNGIRLTHDQVPGASVKLFSSQNGGIGNSTEEGRALERARFFLTTHSRSPELNVFGQPRVAMWPVANKVANGQMKGNPESYRTIFDNLIEACSTLAAANDKSSSNSYVFMRADSTSPTHDFSNIQRNRELLTYLFKVMQRPFPSGGVGSVSFVDKFGRDEAAQILTLIFDYIRSTNLYDGVLAPPREELLNTSGPYRRTGSVANILTQRDNLRNTSTKTFTSDRSSGSASVTNTNTGATHTEQISSSGFPGHGQVVPIRTNIDGIESQGLGRFVTVSEVGFHFIATADGTPDPASWPVFKEDGTIDSTQPRHGGRTAPKVTNDEIEDLNGSANAVPQRMIHPVTGGNVIDRWFSNFPPRPMPTAYGTNFVPTSKNYFAIHPGFNAKNWNTTLDDGIALQPNQRRIQAMLALELTTVAAGYTGIYPDLTIRVTGANGMAINTVDGPQLLFPAQEYYWRAPASLFQTTHNRENGSSVGPHAMIQSRYIAGRRGMPVDPSYQPAYTDSAATYEGGANFDLVSDFFTIQAQPPGTPLTAHNVYNPLQFTGGSLTIEIYAGRTANAANLVQTVKVRVPDVDLRPPQLVTISTAKSYYIDSGGTKRQSYRTEGPRWWSFNYGGAIGRYIGIYNPANPIHITQGMPQLTPANSSSGDYATHGLDYGRTLGRFYNPGDSQGKRVGILRADSLFWAYHTGGSAHPNGGNYRDYLHWAPTVAQTPSTGLFSPQSYAPFGQDTVFSMVPTHHDIRILAAKKLVPESDWELHPSAGNANATNPHMAHTFMRFATSYEDGVDIGTDNAYRLVNYGNYTLRSSEARPDFSPTSRVRSQMEAQTYGDFDTGQGSMRDGPWINKPDEGNTGIQNKSGSGTSGAGNFVRTPTAYYDEMWSSSEAGESIMSPNRMVSSPGMFGSLPVGVKRDLPWRTLLFRPWIPMSIRPNAVHPGSPNYGASGNAEQTAAAPYKGINPADHYIMDLFWMPVVEPYAISEAFSTAGKINMNYQIVPFKHIRRATGLHAAMKDEIISAVPTSNIGEIHFDPPSNKYMQFGFGQTGYYYHTKWSDQPSKATTAYYGGYSAFATLPRYWHRKIAIDERASNTADARIVSTLGQFEDRFNFEAVYPKRMGGLFRTTSQIAEVHLVPQKIQGVKPAAVQGSTTDYTDGSDAGSNSYDYRALADFWNPRIATGDNLRERPYTHLYAKLTTQSNTYRVHFKVQIIRKARSVAPDEINLAADSVTSEYRGSALVERYLNPADPRLSDYGKQPDAEPLDRFYNFRILENKRFAP